MTYTLLKGQFVIRYPDLPRQGPEPDGDTVKFRPDTPTLVGTLPRRSGRPPKINSRGISVRLEATDATETHFGEAHQNLTDANAARDELLRLLGFTNVQFMLPDLPNKIQSADQDSIRGHILSNGVDANGRLIAFVYPGDPVEPDGSAIFVDEDRVDQSANAKLLTGGYVYPAFYATLPADLRKHLAEASIAARSATPPLRLWASATADPNGTAEIADLAALQELVIWPKLFRRLVPYLASHTDFDGFDAWLREDGVNRDDAIFLLEKAERGNLHDIIRAAGHQIALTAWPEQFIIDPDPAPPGVPTGPSLYTAGAVQIVAALPDPAGADRGHETITLLNITESAVDFAGWKLVDAAGGTQALQGKLAAGAVTQVTLEGTLRLGNRGDTVILLDDRDASIDRVAYKEDEVRVGRTICFGR